MEPGGGGASAGAQAAPKTASLTYKCKFPLVGTQPVKLDLALDIPDSWPVGEPTAPFRVDAKIAISGTVDQGLALVDGLHVLGGVSEAQKPGKGTAMRARVVLPDGTGVNVRVPIDIAPYTVVPPIPNPLVLNASGTTPSLTLDAPGSAYLVLSELVLNLYARNTGGEPVEGLTTPPTDIDRVPYADIDGDPGTFNVPCKLDPANQSVQIPIGPPFDPDPPSKPVAPDPLDYDGPDFTDSSINLKWRPASSDGQPIVSYRIDYEGAPAGGVLVPAGANTGLFSRLITGLDADSEYVFSVTAIDAAGNESEPLKQTLATNVVDCGPAAPGAPTGSSTATSISLSWIPATSCDGVIAKYDVYAGTTKVATTTSTSATITGLQPNTDYTYTVRATDGTGTQGPSSPAATLRTLPLNEPPVDFRLAISGSTQLRTLTKGTLNLTGLFRPKLVIATGQVTAELTLNDTSGRLVAAGFLPVTAKVGFASSNATTGTLINGVLKTNTKVRIKVKEIKLFGAIPLVGGNTCQTKSLTDLSLTSTQPDWNPLQGGPIAGTYRISDLNGCGALNGLVSPLTAGGGNTIALNLAPAV